jgi:hypothetical protein
MHTPYAHLERHAAMYPTYLTRKIHHVRYDLYLFTCEVERCE